MKKTFLAKRNALISSASFSWGGVALLGVVFVVFLRVLFPDIFWTLSVPVFRTSDALASANHSFFAKFNDAAALTEKYEILLKENEALASENLLLSKKISSLMSLDGTSGMSPAQSSSIVAGIIARPPMSPYDTLVLAEGSRAGVTVGMEAFGAGGVPLGIVADVSSNTARVVLFSASGVSTSGWVGKDNVAITLYGMGGGALSASLPRAAGIVVGDIVYVPGPGMLPVGAVSRIDGGPSSPSVTLRISPSINIFSISDVRLRSTGPTLYTSILSATTTSL